MKRFASVSLVALIAVEAAYAQDAPAGPAETRIIADTAAQASLGTMVTSTGNTYTIDGGRVAGANLFHSFANFDVARGDVARWTHSGGNPASIANVVNRVTGGEPSLIFGTLDSTVFPNADFYFINPVGIVFGEGASVNVPAAAYFSTASELRFVSGPAFQVAEPNGTLSVASPEAFGFRGDEGAILLTSVDERLVRPSNRLSLSASTIEIENSHFTPGSLLATAVGSSDAAVGVEEDDALGGEGGIQFVDSVITTLSGPQASGRIAVTGGAVTLSQTHLATSAGVAEDGTAFAGGDILLRATRHLTLRDARIGTASEVEADGGDVRLIAGELTINGPQGRSDSGYPVARVPSIATLTSGGGEGGDIILESQTVSITSAGIEVRANGCSDAACGTAGAIRIEAEDVRLLDGFIVNEVENGGSPARIFIVAGGSVEITASTVSTESYDSSSFFIPVESAPIRISGAEVKLVDSVIQTEVLGLGSLAGNVNVEASGRLELVNSDVGSIAVACQIAICESGVVALSGGEIVISGSSIFSSPETGAGFSGSVTIASPGDITFSASGVSGATGGAEVTAGGDLRVIDSAFSVGIESPRALTSGTLDLSGRNVVIDTSSLNIFVVVQTFNGGVAIGSGSITAEDELRVTGTDITLRNINAGGGRFVLFGGRVQLRDTRLRTSALDATGGSFFLGAADTLTLDGVEVSTLGLRSGRAGNISLTAPTYTISDSVLSSDAQQSADGGSISLVSERDAIVERSRVSTDTEEGVGGDISFTMASGSLLFLRGQGDQRTIITTSADSGSGGRISIASPLAILADGSSILALGESGGANVQIDTGFFIASADRPNEIAVDGELRFENPVADVSAGTVETELSVLDASGVLRSQCSAVRSSGRLSQLSVRPTGPYIVTRRYPSTQPPADAGGTGGAGGCQ